MIDVLPIGKLYLSSICDMMVNVNSVLCVKCGDWIHIRCAAGKRVTQVI